MGLFFLQFALPRKRSLFLIASALPKKRDKPNAEYSFIAFEADLRVRPAAINASNVSFWMPNVLFWAGDRILKTTTQGARKIGHLSISKTNYKENHYEYKLNVAF